MLSHKKHVDVPSHSETPFEKTKTWDRLARQVFYLANGVRDLPFIARLLHKPEARIEQTAHVMAHMGELTIRPETRIVSVNADVLQHTYNVYILPRRDEFSHRFYERLFQKYPQVKPMFARISIEKQEQAFIIALTTTISGMKHGEAIAQVLKDLGKRHVGYGVLPEYYPLACGVLLETLHEFMGPAFTQEVEQTWRDGLDIVSGVMLEGAIVG